MLATYELQTERLLQNPQAPTALYSTTDLDSCINTARAQIAGESKCVRALGTLQTNISQQTYGFSSISFDGVASQLKGAIHVRSMRYKIGPISQAISGSKFVYPRSWPYLETFFLSVPVVSSGYPRNWSQYSSGLFGSFVLDRPPDALYTLILDCVCLPIDLVTDSDPEAISPLWTDAVPYFAAYCALLAAQTGQRQADADRMFQRYEEFMQRARTAATPDVEPQLYDQYKDPASMTRFGLQQQPQQGGGR